MADMRGGFRWFKSFRVVAILAVRNEQHYVRRCLQHLTEQNIAVCLIDNDSTDATREIVAEFEKRSTVIRYIQHPYPGYYDWENLLRLKQHIATEIQADWFIHLDADEIPESPLAGKTLAQAIRFVDRQGYNAINFNEFVFIPTNNHENWENRDYVEGMKKYYFFAPRPQRLVRAWKKQDVPVDIAQSGGHECQFSGRKVYPQSFVLRHYIALSRTYLITKYCSRNYAQHEVERGWHHNRIGITPERVHLPRPEELKTYRNDGKWDTSSPWTEHFFSLAP
jgi:glycosyltransferase involved in cell wall biosynthesis